MRALQSSSQDCWPGFSSPGPGPDNEDQYEDGMGIRMRRNMAKNRDMDEDKEEKKESVNNNDEGTIMRARMRMIYEDVDGMPSPPWAVRTRCSLLFPANKHLYVMVHQKPEHS